MADYSDAIDYFVDPSRVFVGQNSHSAIVLHGTGGPATWTAQQLGDYFRTTPEMTSSHFGVDRNGVVCQYVSLADGSAANCCKMGAYDPFWDQFGDNLNLHTISIEHVNDSANSLPLTDAQKQTSFKLVAWLCKQYGLTQDKIKTHASIDPINRSHCPGPAYPFDELFAYLEGATPVQQYSPNSRDFGTYWTDNGNGTWTVKSTGMSILGANLSLYKSLSIDGSTLPVIGLPRTNELYQHDANGYSWSVQFFERGVIAYDPNHQKDSAPGQGDSYLGKQEQFQHLDPGYQSPNLAAVSAAIEADIQAIVALASQTGTTFNEALEKLRKDAGL